MRLSAAPPAPWMSLAPMAAYIGTTWPEDIPRPMPSEMPIRPLLMFVPARSRPQGWPVKISAQRLLARREQIPTGRRGPGTVNHGIRRAPPPRPPHGKRRPVRLQIFPRARRGQIRMVRRGYGTARRGIFRAQILTGRSRRNFLRQRHQPPDGTEAVGLVRHHRHQRPEHQRRVRPGLDNR